MTFGEKLSKLRKEYNYSQEQLAGILGISRQSISKWESNIAYPETDKLIKMGQLFECSMDYLLNEEVTEKQGASFACVSAFALSSSEMSSPRTMSCVAAMSGRALAAFTNASYRAYLILHRC